MEITGGKLGGRQLRNLLEITLRPREKTRVRLYPFAMAILNLAVCAYVDHFLQDNLFHGLCLFLLAETSFGVLCFLVIFNAAVAPVLNRTRIFPVDFRVRFLFTLITEIRHPLTMGWSGSTMLFLLVLSRFSALSAFLTAAIFVFLVLIIVSLFSLRASSAYSHMFSVHELGLMMITATFFFLVTSILFSIESPAEHIPLISWAAHGIAAGRTGDINAGIRDLFLLAALSMFFLSLGFLRNRGG